MTTKIIKKIVGYSVSQDNATEQNKAQISSQTQTQAEAPEQKEPTAPETEKAVTNKAQTPAQSTNYVDHLKYSSTQKTWTISSGLSP